MGVPDGFDLDLLPRPSFVWTAINSRSQSSKTKDGAERKPNLSDCDFLVSGSKRFLFLQFNVVGGISLKHFLAFVHRYSSDTKSNGWICNVSLGSKTFCSYNSDTHLDAVLSHIVWLLSSGT